MKTDAIRTALSIVRSNEPRDTCCKVADEARAELAELENEIKLHDELVMMQHELILKATKLWQQATGTDSKLHPDMGQLLEWLITQIVAKDEALRDLLDAFWDMSPLEYAQSRDLPFMSYGEGERIKERARTALSSPTGKVLVDREKLQAIEFIKVGNLQEAISRKGTRLAETIWHRQWSNPEDCLAAAIDLMKIIDPNHPMVTAKMLRETKAAKRDSYSALKEENTRLRNALLPFAKHHKALETECVVTSLMGNGGIIYRVKQNRGDSVLTRGHFAEVGKALAMFGEDNDED